MNGQPLPYDEAQRIILASLRPLEKIRLPLGESGGHVLAEDVNALEDIPPFHRSMMDGYALRSADVQNASPQNPVPLKVVGELPAGDVPGRGIFPGEAMRIMTGGMIPEGADAVCRLEATKEAFARNGQTVHVAFPVKPGDNIAFKGEDIAKGSCVIRRGTRIGAAETAVLAALGYGDVPVYRKPRVAILSCGSELVDVGNHPGPGKIRNSNAPMIAALIGQAGGTPVVLPAAADDVEKMVDELSKVLDEVDAVVTTGGVSVGDYDLIPEVYEKLGAKTVFWKVLVRPGSPFRYALLEGKPFFGASGNPAAAFVNVQLFVLPALRLLSGEAEPVKGMVKARLRQGAAKGPVKHVRFLRGKAVFRDGRLEVDIAGGQSSAMIGSLLNSNCLVRIESGQTPSEGDEVEVLLYGEAGSG